MSKASYTALNPQVALILGAYPQPITKQILKLRKVIFSTAKELNKDIEETLKWNEPSYLTKSGSTIRIAWKKSLPNQYGMYFNCKTTLLATFKEIYPQAFNYAGDRAIIFQLHHDVHEKKLKHCIQLALNYHAIKHLPLLGV